MDQDSTISDAGETWRELFALTGGSDEKSFGPEPAGETFTIFLQ